jgi:hypothetical protein
MELLYLYFLVFAVNYIHISRFCITTLLGMGVGVAVSYFVCVNKQWPGVHYILPKILTLYIAC